MKRILCSYAYDVPHYYDFVVEVPDEMSEAAAEKFAEARAEQALSEGLFEEKIGSPCYENSGDERVFVSGLARTDRDSIATGEDEPVLETLAVPIEVKEPNREPRIVTLHIKEPI